MHHSNSGSNWLTLALSQAHSRTFWLTLTQSGSLWLSQALCSSSRLHILDAWPQFILACFFYMC